MEHVSPGIIINARFCQAASKTFSEYVRYMDREEAIRNNHFDMFSLYNNYMENPEKSSGLFTSDKDKLTQDEIKSTKEIFNTAQAKGSLMWQPIISFDNDYLEENGLYDRNNSFLNEDKIRELTRGTVNNILKGENMEDSAFWTASIHYNTDNIHIHIAIVEPEPQRERVLTGKYAGQFKGTFKQSSINAGKRFAVNYVLDNQLVNSKINEIIRDNIISKKKEHPLYKDKDFIKEFMRIHNK
uniref:MobP2 family relaxase n=1 Tax=Serratia marcescens TaxID=615 RepID=UPI001CA35342